MGMLVSGSWLADDEAYRSSREGAFVRPTSAFMSSVGNSPTAQFQPAYRRYHLYVALSCPWAHRALIVRALKGLEDCIPISVVAPWTRGAGWGFAEYPGATGDQINGFEYLHETYKAACSTYTGRVTVPVLWDTETSTIVCNDSASIMRMLNSEFDQWATRDCPDLYPSALRAEIDAVNAQLYSSINHGVYRAGFATTQAKHQEAVFDVFKTLDEYEARLSRNRYLCGSTITEADWRFFTTLIRFDAVYYLHFKCNIRRIVDYPNMAEYVRELYQWPGIAATVNFDHIKRHYFTSHLRLNPTGLIPVGPALDFTTPHHRGEIGH